jgi:diaminohydroxyphosphoribosylaminopyrimidine deaminase/5-amino-6-(5-phosphoribosylamino)uracil reductase
LAAEGIEVLGPLMSEEEAARENPGFFHRVPDRPWIDLKLALSLDARISSRSGVRTLLSGEAASEEVHRLRAGFDGILIGSRTAQVDDPALTVRGKVIPRVPPRRVVFDSRGVLGEGSRLFAEGGGEVWILTTEVATPEWRETVARAGGRVFILPADRAGQVSLMSALSLLSREGVRTLLCEGGGILGSALLTSDVVDRLDLILSPIFLGEEGVPAFALPDAGDPLSGRRWSPLERPRYLGEDLWISLERRRN